MQPWLARLLRPRSLDPLRPIDAVGEELLVAGRSRRVARLADRDRLVSLGLAGAFMVAAAAMAAVLPAGRHASPLVWLAFVGAYAAATTVEFEVGPTVGVPSELAFVPMLFLLPPSLVPLAVAAGALLGELVAWRPDRRLVRRLVLALVSSWHAIGPALLLALAGAHPPRWHDAPLYLLALALDLVGSAGVVLVRHRLAFGTRPRTLVRFLLWVCLVDVLLAPVGFAAALAPVAFLGVVPLLVLLRLFAAERTVRLEHALELSAAYRRTAVVLSDVVELDDAYTGLHSRGVARLALTVAGSMALDAEGRRDVELAALLHDVGKLLVPNEIINKPGRLTPSEWAVVKAHTLTGEQILQQVGGTLGDVGGIVRSSHERWDGTGYPDGLAGDQIPLAARIVAACDAYDAMTTDRPYRAAHGTDAALAELWRCAGSQFDPVVVRHLAAIVERPVAVERRAA